MPDNSESDENITLRASALQASEFHFDDDSFHPRDAFKKAVEEVSSSQFKKGEEVTLSRILDEIDKISLKRSSEGLNDMNFSIGVLNCFFIIYMFGAHPEHVWLIYVIEGLYMIPKRFSVMWKARPLNQALYYLDFCWMMNFMGSFLIFVLVIFGLVGGNLGTVSNGMREACFNAFLGVATGPLMGANIVLPFVACLFHDVSTMTGLFIHIMPPMVMYTFMWKGDLIREVWPGVFDLSYLDHVHYFPEGGMIFAPGSGLDSVAGNSVTLYLLWWTPYVCFMLLFGIDLPKKLYPDGTPANPKYDTVFHSTMRGGTCFVIGKVFRGRSKKDSLKQCEENSFDLIDFFIYMAFHMILALSAIFVIGYPCFISERFHFGMICVVATLAVMRGSKRYTYYTTKMYAKQIRNVFAVDKAKQKHA